MVQSMTGHTTTHCILKAHHHILYSQGTPPHTVFSRHTTTYCHTVFSKHTTTYCILNGIIL